MFDTAFKAAKAVVRSLKRKGNKVKGVVLVHGERLPGGGPRTRLGNLVPGSGTASAIVGGGTTGSGGTGSTGSSAGSGTGSAGSGTPHNVLNPYTCLNFIIKT
jgi:hypothetical protein